MAKLASSATTLCTGFFAVTTRMAETTSATAKMTKISTLLASLQLLRSRYQLAARRSGHEGLALGSEDLGAAPRGLVTALGIDRRFLLRHRAEITGNAARAIVGRRTDASIGRHQEKRLVVDERAAAVIGHLETRRQRDRISRTCLFAHTAEDAAQLVDFVAERVALTRRLAVIRRVLRADDGDCVGRAGDLAELAADAPLFTVRVAAQLVQAVKARGMSALDERIVDRRLSAEQIAERRAQSFEYRDDVHLILRPRSLSGS